MKSTLLLLPLIALIGCSRPTPPPPVTPAQPPTVETIPTPEVAPTTAPATH